MRASLWIAAATATATITLVPIGCGSHAERPDEGAGRAQEADDVSCNLSTVAWDDSTPPSARTCAGPWVYQRVVSPCYAQRADDPACPPALDANGNYEYENYPDQCRDYQACDVPTWGTETQQMPLFLLHFSNNQPMPHGSYPIVTIDSSTFPNCSATDPNCGRTDFVKQVVEAQCAQEETSWFNDQVQTTIPFDVKPLMSLTPPTGYDGQPIANSPLLPGAKTALWANVVEQCTNDYQGKEQCSGDASTQLYQNIAFWETDTSFGCRSIWSNYPTSYVRDDAHLNYRDANGKAILDDPCPLARAPYDCVDYTKIKHTTCRQPSFGNDPDPTACGATPDTYYSAPGLTLAQLKSGDAAAAFSLDATTGLPKAAAGTPLPVCLTGEDLPMKTADQARAKQDALLKRIAQASGTGYPSSVDTTGLLQKLVVNAKLTFEAAGGGFSGAPGDVIDDPTVGDQIAASLALYTRYSSAPYTPTCGHSPAPPDLSKCDLSKLTTAQINTAVATCERMLSAHASPQLRGRAEVMQACLALAPKILKTRDRMVAHGETDDGSDANGGNDVCQYKQYRDRFDETVTRPLRETLASAVDPRTSPDETSRRLAAVDAWFTTIETLYQGASTDAARWASTSDTVGAFWRGMYRELYPMGDPYAPPASELAVVPPSISDAGTEAAAGAGDAGATSTPVTADQIQAAAHDELDADRAILIRAFTPWASGIAAKAGAAATLPLTHAPLVYVLADALTAMHQRLADLALYHDVGCAYLGCDGQTYPSEAARLWRLLAFVGDAKNLAADMSVDQMSKDETGQPVVRGPWLEVFQPMSDHHAAIDLALADLIHPAALAGDAGATTPPPLDIVATPLDALPTPLVPLAMLVRDAHAKAHAYQGSGLLLGPADHLRAGAHDEYLESRRQILGTLNGSLQTDVGSYRTAMQSLASAAIQQFDFTSLDADANTNLLQTLQQIDTLQSQESALRAGIEGADQAFAHHMDGYAQLAKINPNGSVQLANTPELTIAASSAKALGNVTLQQNLPTIAAAAAVTLTPGQILHLETSGQYAPACAVATSPAAQIPGTTTPTKIGAANPFTGPEGYLLQVSGSSIQTESHQDAQTHNDSNATSSTFAACGGMKTSLTFGTPGIAELFSPAKASTEIYASIEGCYKTDNGSSDVTSSSDMSSSGSDGHVSASFNAGLRLANAPYPNLPAGALLLVVTPQGQPTVTKDVRVVQEPYTTYVADGPVDVYYVVNDLNPSGTPGCHADDSRTLDVKGSILMHTGAMVQGLQPVIGQVIDAIEAQVPAIVRQGRLLPEEAASLRASALQQISAAGLDMTTFPAPVQSFLDAWIDAVLARIELQIEHDRVALDLSAKILALRGLVDDMNNARQRGRIATLLGNWALRDLDGDAIRSDARQVADMLLNDMYPVIKLRDRSLFATLSTEDDFKGALLALIRTPWDASIDTVGKGLYDATKDVLNGLATVDGSKPELTQELVLEIPRPGNPASTSWYVADDGRADIFWTGLSSDAHVASITIDPGDFYRKGAGLGISCAYETPVIRDMAIVFSGLDDTTAANENARPWNAQVTTDATMLFPTGAILGSDPASGLPIVFSSGGPLRLDVTDPAWTAPVVRMLFDKNAGDADHLYDTMRPDGATTNSARGLSPFTTFTFDMSQLWDPNLWPPPDPNVNTVNPGDAATAVEIVMRVEARSVGVNSSLTWIPKCK